jgi:hypothetical protein
MTLRRPSTPPRPPSTPVCFVTFFSLILNHADIFLQFAVFARESAQVFVLWP